MWDDWSRRHIEHDHPERAIGVDDVEQVMNDPDRIETTEERDGETYHALLGQTGAGGLLLVVWIDHPSGRYPVHAHRAGRREARKYYR